MGRQPTRSRWHNFASHFTVSSVTSTRISSNDECGACEFYTGGSKLIPTPGTKGKIDLREVEAALTRQHELHSHKPRVISLAQATEVGTVYVPDEVREISAFANKRGMFLHMDGARFANAIATLRCAPKEITWRAGVEVLCFGGTKNGLAAGELVVFFNKERSADFGYRVKQGGHLASKMRFLAAPCLALLADEVWLKNARQANEAALKLASGLRSCGAEIVFPIESNAGIFSSRCDGCGESCASADGIFTNSSSRTFIV
jgi:threonine aldolase